MATDTKLTNLELADKLEQWAINLAKSGGKSWTLEIPANDNKDPDLLMVEAAQRLRGIPNTLTNLEQEAEKYINRMYGSYCNRLLAEKLNHAFIVGASHASQSVPGDIVERLENSHPFDTGLGAELRLYEIWMECCAKLRELLSQSSIKEKK